MSKLKPFIVEYEEVLKKSYIVYAEDQAHASEIMTEKAFNDELDLSNLDFDHWNTDVIKEAEEKDLPYFDVLNKADHDKEMSI